MSQLNKANLSQIFLFFERMINNAAKENSIHLILVCYRFFRDVNCLNEVKNSVLKNVLEIYKNNYPIIKLRTPVYVIGDLHGNFHDFLRIFNSIKDPFSKTFLFLGDYIDRGQFQTEIITLLLTLTAQYPSNFILLRGNHEFADMN